jgi:creatinine amidohydrolase
LTETRLELLTHEEVGALDRERTVVIVPTAAIEQHGPHLPLDTDTFLCTSVAREGAARARDALVTPTVCFGSSEHHMAFPGTVTLSHDTFRDLVADVCRSLARHGFGRLLVVNGHGGNTALNAATVQQLGFEAPVHVLAVDYWTFARPVLDDVRESPTGGMGHACEFETSLMLHLRPESVRRDLVVREIVQPRYTSERFDLFETGGFSAHWKTHELSHSGVMGAPDLATEEKGRRLFEACVDGLAALIEELRARPLPAG